MVHDNFNNVSREVEISAKTVKEYFQILEDTLIGFFLHAFTKSPRERLVLHPKFFFFDPGVVSTLKNTLSSPLVPSSFPYGNAFEHWIILEMRRILEYREREFKVSFFRTSDGAEVDIILEWEKGLWAIEIKSSSAPRPSDVRGLASFIKDHTFSRAICVCQTPRRYESGKIEFINWKDFLAELQENP